MPDRVFFATSENDETGLSGFNGFPFPLSDTTLSVGLAYADFFLLFWRVRSWAVVVTSPTPGEFTISAAHFTLGTLGSEIGLLFAGNEGQNGAYFDDGGSNHMAIIAAYDDTGDIFATFTGNNYTGGTWSGSAITFTGATATPSEFWPYENSNGDPIYDTATGAEINDPLS